MSASIFCSINLKHVLWQLFLLFWVISLIAANIGLTVGLVAFGMQWYYLDLKPFFQTG